MPANINHNGKLWPNYWEKDLKKKKKLLLFFKYLCWKNLFFKRPDCKCLRLSGGQAWPLLQIFLHFSCPLKKKKETNYALKRKVNAIPNSWAIVRLLQLQSKAFKTYLNSRKLLFKRDLMSTAVIKSTLVRWLGWWSQDTGNNTVSSRSQISVGQLYRVQELLGIQFKQLGIGAPENVKDLQQSNKPYAVIKTKTNSDFTSIRKKGLNRLTVMVCAFFLCYYHVQEPKQKLHSLSLTCTMSWIEMRLQFTHFLPVPVLPERAYFYLFSPESLCKSLNWFPCRLLLDSPLSGLSQPNSERLNFVTTIL